MRLKLYAVEAGLLGTWKKMRHSLEKNFHSSLFLTSRMGGGELEGQKTHRPNLLYLEIIGRGKGAGPPPPQ